jgi:hypothetical protein
MFFNSGAVAAVLLNRKKYKPTIIKCDLKLAKEHIEDLHKEIDQERLKYIGWRNKVRKFFRMRLLTEQDAHKILNNPSDVFDKMVGYPAKWTEVQYLEEIVSNPENQKRGYYERIF